jgi:serine/threonine protein kinase
MSSPARGDSRSVPSPDSIDAAYGDFEHLADIGTGGNATVAKMAYQGPGPDVVALKQPQMQGTLEIDAVDEFTSEADTWAKLDDHDHIVGVLDWGSTPFPWLALEYMDGGDLSDRLGQVDPAEAFYIGRCVARAVRHAHRRGVAHLDLKPENILFRQTSDGWDVPKVADWGLAKMLLDHSKSVEQLSFHYAAPEQFDSDTFGSPDDFTDIYATGAVVYAMLVGEPPFPGSMASVVHSVTTEEPDPPSDHVGGLPRGTDAVLQQALAMEKDDRYESVLDLRRDLNTLCERALGRGDEGSLIAETGSHAAGSAPDGSVSSSAAEPGVTGQPDGQKADSESQTDVPPGEPTPRGTAMRNTPDTSQSDQRSEQIHNPKEDRVQQTDTLAVPGYHYYAGGSVLLMCLGFGFGVLANYLAPLFIVAVFALVPIILGGFGVTYYLDKDIDNLSTVPETDWSAREDRYFCVLFFSGLFPFALLYYWYKRREVTSRPDVDSQLPPLLRRFA